MPDFEVSIAHQQKYLKSKLSDINQLLESAVSNEVKTKQLLNFLHQLKGGAPTFKFANLAIHASNLEAQLQKSCLLGESVSIDEVIDSIHLKLSEELKFAIGKT